MDQIVTREMAFGTLPPGAQLLPSDPFYDTLLISPPENDPTVMTADADSLFVVRKGVVHKIDKATMKEVGKLDVNERRIRIHY